MKKHVSEHHCPRLEEQAGRWWYGVWLKYKGRTLTEPLENSGNQFFFEKIFPNNRTQDVRPGKPLCRKARRVSGTFAGNKWKQSKNGCER